MLTRKNKVMLFRSLKLVTSRKMMERMISTNLWARKEEIKVGKVVNQKKSARSSTLSEKSTSRSKKRKTTSNLRAESHRARVERTTKGLEKPCAV